MPQSETQAFDRNTSSDLAIVIMAAGKGTRLNSRRPKVLHEIGGRALLLHVIAAAKSLVPPDRIYCIVGHESEKVRHAIAHTGVHFMEQVEQRGTGHALKIAKAHFAASGDPIPGNLLVLSGDVPLIRPDTLRNLADFHRSEHAAMTILTAVPNDPTGYGRVIRKSPGSPEVTAIVEQKSLLPSQLSAPEINSGIYCFQSAALFGKLDLLSTNNAHGEFYLTDVAALLVADGQKVVATRVASIDEVLGANTIAEMMHLDAAMRLATARRLMSEGVTIFRPDTCVIDSEVDIAPDTIIEPYVQLLGPTRIGAGCRIRSYSVIQSSQLGEAVLVRNGCILDGATVADGAILGPYAHLRPESHIGPAAHVGNFCETKKVTLGAGSKANHLTYLGDAVIGSGVNIGAGTITCNYDGVHKNLTTIGDHAFIGSDSTLVAPVTIGEGAYVAAGSSITEDVPSDALAFGRARQVVKSGWAAARREAIAVESNVGTRFVPHEISGAHPSRSRTMRWRNVIPQRGTDMPRLTDAELDIARRDLPLWQLEDGKLIRDYTFADFAAAMVFVNKVANLAESANHHPDIDIRYNQVRLALISHDSGGLTRRDIKLASRIDADLPQ